MQGLTDLQKRFVLEYLKDLNGKQAAIRAGYAPKKADSYASQLLKIPKVQDAVRKQQEKYADRLEVTTEKVLREMASIGFANAGDFFEWGPSGVSLIPKENLTREQMAAVSEASQTVTESGGTIKLKLHDKIGALTKLGQHLGLFTEKHEHKHSGKVEISSDEERREKLELLVRFIETRTDDDDDAHQGTAHQRLGEGDGGRTRAIASTDGRLEEAALESPGGAAEGGLQISS
jgi:phage terminase small subunit